MQPFYENMDWRDGPHFFVPHKTTFAHFGFNDPMNAGTHASCFNFASIGIEMVGKFDAEAFDSGLGAVAENTIYLMALLHTAIGITLEPYMYGKQGLHSQNECKADNHDCPGKFVYKPDVMVPDSRKKDPSRLRSVSPTRTFSTGRRKSRCLVNRDELKIEENQIPVTVLASILPIVKP